MKARLLLTSSLFLILLAVAACGATTTTPSSGAPSPTKQATEVQITLTDFAIKASQTEFTVGVPYRFVVTNSGQTQHELMAVPSSTGQASEEEIDAARLFEIEDVNPGQLKTGVYTFTQAAAAGTLEFACHKAGHYEAGMRMSITVK
ncbi:MAG TPA: hypothetical protein VFQ25_11965 [Ktedonobacterales bacterium]|nr:hypothetical protein [Ktedonobacterales bacterium]